jgi:DNA polymerase III subunit delta'
VPLVPLFGHEQLQDRLLAASRAGRLPASLLLHGPAGAGKQRLALWLAQALLCERDDAPCGRCQSCRYALELTHPDLHWIFPRPRLKNADASVDDVRQDYAEAIAERVQAGGLYPRPSGSEGIFVTAVRTIVHRAGISPAVGRRKVFVVGDAERMVPQESSPEAANAFLKLLEEPPADTTIIVTSSEPGALLPTIRSRVIAVRVSPLPQQSVRAFLRHAVVQEALSAETIPADETARLALAAGAPGTLIGGAERSAALEQARRFLEVADRRDRAAALKLSFQQGVSKARGRFSDVLDALITLQHARARDAVARADAAGAMRAARGVEAAERAKELAAGNVSPNLVTVRLLSELSKAS